MIPLITTSSTIDTPTSTNSFSYLQRKEFLSHNPSITITPWKQGTIDDVEIGKHIVIEEIDHNNNLQSHTGLHHNILIINHLQSQMKAPPIAIMDNHNHALYFWTIHKQQHPHQHIEVIHIDAHADLEDISTKSIEREKSTPEQIREYTHTQTHIGSFIPPAINSNIISICHQVRSSYALENITPPTSPFILDIDLDFWMDLSTIHSHHITKLQSLLSQADLVTIATSPYFLDQKKAIGFLRQLLD